MQSHKLAFKLFTKPGTMPDIDLVVPIYHKWIQTHAIKDHLLIDVETLPPDNLPIPNDANHRHFGLGQTETELTLPPGQHTLQLVLGDALHIPHQPPVVSEKITITVQ